MRISTNGKRFLSSPLTVNIIFVISSMKVFILLQLLAPRLLAAEHSSGTYQTNKLEWAPVLPIKFHQDVMLQCGIPNCCTNTTQWIGGPEGTLLTYQRHSLNNTKYKEIWGRNVNYLVIKNFDLDDVNCVYTCYHGFDFYSRNLTIDGNQFELLPTKDTIKKEIKLSAGQLEVNIEFLEVYPKPECMISFGKEDISNQLLRHEQREVLSFFFRVKYYLKYEVCAEECNDSLTITCLIGSQYITVLESYLVLQTRSCNHSVFIFLFALLTWMLSGCLWLFIFLCRRWRFKHESSRQILPVFAAVGLALVMAALVFLHIGDSCIITTIHNIDSTKTHLAAYVFSFVGSFTIFCIVASLLVFRKVYIKKDNNKLFVIACLQYWCCAGDSRSDAADGI